MVQLLLDAGVHVDIPDKRYGQTPLHIASFNDNKAAVVTLINAGANIDARDRRGNTPLALVGYEIHRIAGSGFN